MVVGYCREVAMEGLDVFENVDWKNFNANCIVECYDYKFKFELLGKSKVFSIGHVESNVIRYQTKTSKKQFERYMYIYLKVEEKDDLEIYHCSSFKFICDFSPWGDLKKKKKTKHSREENLENRPKEENNLKN